MAGAGPAPSGCPAPGRLDARDGRHGQHCRATEGGATDPRPRLGSQGSGQWRPPLPQAALRLQAGQEEEVPGSQGGKQVPPVPAPSKSPGRLRTGWSGWVKREVKLVPLFSENLGEKGLRENFEELCKGETLR